MTARPLEFVSGVVSCGDHGYVLKDQEPCVLSCRQASAEATDREMALLASVYDVELPTVDAIIAAVVEESGNAGSLGVILRELSGIDRGCWISCIVRLRV